MKRSDIARQLILATVGAVVTTGVIYLLPHEAAKLVIPGIVSERVKCEPGRPQVCDALEGKEYRRAEIQTQDCTVEGLGVDGGVLATAHGTKFLGPKHLQVVEGSCVEGEKVAGVRVQDAGVGFLPLACACRKAKGECQYVTDDGGLMQAPFGQTLGPGYPPFESWVGAGCVPKACVELAGSTSWPAQCPRR
jgi:hypothetical protein